MHTIYIVEDDENIRNMVAYALSSAQFVAREMGSGEALWQAMEEEAPALILLDIMLPGEDGISILSRLKRSARFKRIPVILLTAKGAEFDRVKGLDLGADDYITKPFSVLELISRIRVVLRRWEGADGAATELRAGGIALSGDKRSVRVDQREIGLTYREFELLYYLMRNQGIALSRNRLLAEVWGFDYSGESRTVDMHIKSLRQKLGESGELIRTVRNVGYKIEE